MKINEEQLRDATDIVLKDPALVQASLDAISSFRGILLLNSILNDTDLPNKMIVAFIG